MSGFTRRRNQYELIPDQLDQPGQQENSNINKTKWYIIIGLVLSIFLVIGITFGYVTKQVVYTHPVSYYDSDIKASELKGKAARVSDDKQKYDNAYNTYYDSSYDSSLTSCKNVFESTYSNQINNIKTAAVDAYKATAEYKTELDKKCNLCKPVSQNCPVVIKKNIDGNMYSNIINNDIIYIKSLTTGKLCYKDLVSNRIKADGITITDFNNAGASIDKTKYQFRVQVYNDLVTSKNIMDSTAINLIDVKSNTVCGGSVAEIKCIDNDPNMYSINTYIYKFVKSGKSDSSIYNGDVVKIYNGTEDVNASTLSRYCGAVPEVINSPDIYANVISCGRKSIDTVYTDNLFQIFKGS